MSDEQRLSEDTDIWARLRQRVQELDERQRGHVSAAALAGKLAERARRLRERAHSGEAKGPQLSLLAFSHGRQRFGIPIADVIEVQALRDYTPVPGAPPFIAGLIPWRGAILSLLDLVRLFGIAEAGLVDERLTLIVGTAGQRVGILPGEVEDLLTVPLQEVKPAPVLQARVPGEWTQGVYDGNRLILRTDQILADPRLVDWKFQA